QLTDQPGLGKKHATGTKPPGSVRANNGFSGIGPGAHFVDSSQTQRLDFAPTRRFDFITGQIELVPLSINHEVDPTSDSFHMRRRGQAFETAEAESPCSQRQLPALRQG